MPTVSVIVPVYNAENALSRCVSSILDQEYKDLELILLDDGSTDQSPAICDDFAKQDDRVIVIHKPNSGVSDTRNQGIHQAKGTYIQFLDADDWIPKDSTKMLVRTAQERNADLVVGEFYRVVGENLSRKGSIETDRVLTTKEYAEFMKLSPADYYYGVIWNKLYKKSILDEYAIQMDPSVSFCEDFIFNLEYLLHCKRIAPLLVPVYYYVKTEGSLVSQNMNLRRLVDMKTSVYQYYDSFFRNVLDEKTYRKERIGIASFLVSGATDEFTIPMAPGTKKVETPHVALDRARIDTLTIGARYIWMLYEEYLATAAMKNDISRNDVLVFAAISLLKDVHSLRQLAAITGLSEPSIMASIQVLSYKHMISVSYLPLSVQIRTDGGAGLLHDIELAVRDLRAVCTEGMDQRELAQLDLMLEKIFNNVEKRLGVSNETA